jgi:hypothetical protein
LALLLLQRAAPLVFPALQQHQENQRPAPQQQQPLVFTFSLLCSSSRKTKGPFGSGANQKVGSASFPAAAAEQGKPKACSAAAAGKRKRIQRGVINNQQPEVKKFYPPPFLFFMLRE